MKITILFALLICLGNLANASEPSIEARQKAVIVFDHLSFNAEVFQGTLAKAIKSSENFPASAAKTCSQLGELSGESLNMHFGVGPGLAADFDINNVTSKEAIDYIESSVMSGLYSVYSQVEELTEKVCGDKPAQLTKSQLRIALSNLDAASFGAKAAIDKANSDNFQAIIANMKANQK